MKHYERGNQKPELIVAIAGPLGTDIRTVAKEIDHALKAYHYRTDHVRVSDLIKQWCSPNIAAKIDQAKEDVRINALMNAGDLLRKSAKNGAVTVPLITTEIRRLRQNFLQEEGCNDDFDQVELYNTCFIVNSLKHPDEVDLLRSIYGDKFILISVTLPQSQRDKSLKTKISKSYRSTSASKYSSHAERLVKKDRERIDTSLGQNISSTFPLADFFIRGNSHLKSDVSCFLRLIFGDQRVTPTRLEYAMYEASANALRSADLSRQVGAVITSERFDIISRGCNEVPVAGGDVYWFDDGTDALDTRDIATGKDFNAVKKSEIIDEIIRFFDENKLMSLGNKSVEELISSLQEDDLRDRFKHLRISNLIEFGRMVHAEMSALMEAARRGLAVQDGILICTTFPCHMCARHIISSGIRKVFFIEPYPKSMTSEIYNDVIEIDPDDDNGDDAHKVHFKSYYGTAPRMFGRVFAMAKRKDHLGYAIEFDEFKSKPITTPLSRSHLASELIVSQTAAFIPKIGDTDEDEVFHAY